jgi:ATP binding cassette subfamily A (ABC1) protein 13
MFLFLKLQVFEQGRQGSLLQKMLIGVSHSLGMLRDQYEEEGKSQKLVEILHTALLVMSDSLAANGPQNNQLSISTDKRHISLFCY